MSKSYSIVGMEHQKSEDLIKALPPGTVVTLIREPNNQYDKNAIAVWFEARKIGYIPKKQNGVLAAFIDQTGAGYDESKLLAMDAGLHARAIDAKFFRSPNSNYPMVEV